MSQINTVYKFELGGLKDSSKEGLMPRFDGVLTKVVGDFNAQHDAAHNVSADNIQWLKSGVMTATFHGSSGRDVQECASKLTRVLCGSLKASAISTIVPQEKESLVPNPDGLDALLN